LLLIKINNLQIHQLAFSAHTDSKGIMDLVKFLNPKHVILVHGEKPKMATLRGKIQTELGIPCYDPANNERVSIPSTHYVKANASAVFIHSSLCPNFDFRSIGPGGESDLGGEETKTGSRLEISDVRVSEGLLVVGKRKKAKVIHQDDLATILRGPEWTSQSDSFNLKSDHTMLQKCAQTQLATDTVEDSPEVVHPGNQRGSTNSS